MASWGRRVCGDLVVSAGVVAAVLGVLVSIDERVREQMRVVARAASPTGIGEAGARVREAGLTLFDAARTQSIEHAPLVIVAVIATVLLLALARS